MPRAIADWPPHALPRLALGFQPRQASSTLLLTEEQVEVAGELGRSHRAVLDGVTGSGKTHLCAAVAAGYASLGKRVLVVCPRRPLAFWLWRALGPLGVEVKTIDSCARAALAARSECPPTRQGYDDPAYLAAATDAVEPGSYDLVIGEEWQTVSDGERGFISRLVGPAAFIAVQDSSRRLTAEPPPSPEHMAVFQLTTGLRSRGRVDQVDAPFAIEGLEPRVTPTAKSCATVTCFRQLGQLGPAVRAAVADLRSKGLALTEIGVVSSYGRAQSTAVASLHAPNTQPRGFHLHEQAASTGLACDSFSYWLGLERRGIVVTEIPRQAPSWRTRVHMAVSRACEHVHFVISEQDAEAPEFGVWR